MKPLILHPATALISAVILVGAGASTRALQAAGQTTAVQGTRLPVHRPDPRDIVSVKEGESLAVPQDRRFVVTGLGSTNPTVASVLLLVNGLPEITTHTETPTTIRETPAWFSVGPGSLISVQGGDGGDPGDGRVFGYLIEN